MAVHLTTMQTHEKPYVALYFARSLPFQIEHPNLPSNKIAFAVQRNRRLYTLARIIDKPPVYKVVSARREGNRGDTNGRVFLLEPWHECI